MIDVPLIDELREVRRRLAEACQGDVVRYAQMLHDRSRVKPENYVTKPLLPSRPEAQPSSKEKLTSST